MRNRENVIRQSFEHLAISLSTGEGFPSMIALTGVGPGVGVSTAASHLARVLAQGRRRILVVTLDPDSAQDGGIQGSIREMPEGYDFACISPRLIPAVGPSDGDSWRELMADVQERYDYVIWDVPPLDALPQSAVVCKHVGGVVLIVDAGKTRGPSARHAKNALLFAGADILGVVLNRKKMYIPRWLYGMFFRNAA